MPNEIKVVEEVAKTTGKAIDLAGGLGDFANEVFGDLVIDAVGLLSDKLKYYRLEKAIHLKNKLEEKIKEKSIKEPKQVNPKIALPLIEQATIEDNEDLHTRWANLLANAMDPKYRGNIKRSYVSILSDMEPVDVLVLDRVIKDYSSTKPEEQKNVNFIKAKIAIALSIDDLQCELALRNLIRLGCLKPGVVQGGIFMGGHSISAYKDTEWVGLTALGIDFYKAVS